MCDEVVVVMEDDQVLEGLMVDDGKEEVQRWGDQQEIWKIRRLCNHSRIHKDQSSGKRACLFWGTGQNSV